MPEFVPINDIEYYSISEYGQVRNERTRKLMAISRNRSGVLFVQMYVEGQYITRSVAQLVAEHFLDPPILKSYTSVIHHDGDKSNCAAGNLSWRTRSYAIAYNRQFTYDRPPLGKRRVYEPATGITFESTREAGIYYGLKEFDIFSSATSGQPNFITKTTFEWTD